MYKFQEITIAPKNNIIFLCGTKYGKTLENDKRNVLQEYIKDKFPNTKAIILEEHFVFGSTPGYLSYDDIFMKNLCDIEELTAAFADGIIIIHDSISTGAELATFASNSRLQHKICVLEPDSTGIEERKISPFLELAFFNEESKIDRIVYYPEVSSFFISRDHIEKRTNFTRNQITPKLAEKIDAFLNKCGMPISVKFEKTRFGKVNSDPGTISYQIEHRELNVSISGKLLLYQMIAMVGLDYIKRNLRTYKLLLQHVDFLLQEYKNLLLESVQESTAQNLKAINISIKESRCKSRNIIAYGLYMMQALGMIELKRKREADTVLYRIGIKGEIKRYWNNLEGMLVEKEDALTRLIADE